MRDDAKGPTQALVLKFMAHWPLMIMIGDNGMICKDISGIPSNINMKAMLGHRVLSSPTWFYDTVGLADEIQIKAE